MKLALSRLLNKKSTVLLGVSIGLSLPLGTWAVSPLTQFIGESLFRLILSPFYLFLQIEVWLLVVLAKYNNFINEGGVVIGWTVLRDLANMFFILILLIISFATIIRAQGYGYKQTLSRLIIVAILINFSRMIVGVLIDFSQIIMLTFVQAFKDVAAGNLIVALGLAKVTAAGDNPMSDTTFIQALLLGAFMLVLATVVIGAFIGLLVARIVKLWILIIMSPMAFLSYVLPRTQGFFNKWVSDLGRNLFSGPTLAFFLWLSFTITGRGDIYREFLKDEVTQGEAINEVSAAASADNIINYIVALALLAGSLQIVAASGAAGASMAGKAAQGVNNYAAKLGRRYPLAMASRAGALASRGIINKEGETRKLLGVWNWGKTPFIGGRVQRTAMKMQGYDAARTRREHEEDTKYIKPTQMSQFYKGQMTKQRLLGSKKLGLAYSTLSSQGGNFDKDVLAARAMLDRGEINISNADWATQQFRRVGDEENMQKIQGQYWTFKDKEEAMRIIRKKGVAGVLTDVKTDNIINPDGTPKDGTMHALEGIFDPSHGDADHNHIASLILKNSKLDRWAITGMMQQHFPWEKYLGEKGAFSTEGGVEPDKRGIADNELSNPAVVAGQVLAKVYPQRMADFVDKDTGRISEVGVFRLLQARGLKDLRDAKIKPGQIGGRLYQWHGETDREFEERRSFASDLDKVYLDNPASLPEYLKREVRDADGNIIRQSFLDSSGNIDKEKFEAFRQQIYKETLGLAPRTLDRDGNKIEDYNDSSHIWDNPDMTEDEKIRMYAMKYVMPRTSRDDIKSQEKTLAKETKEGLEARELIFGMTENPEKYKQRYNEVVDQLKRIQGIDYETVKPQLQKVFGNDEEVLRQAFKDMIRSMMAEMTGDNRMAHNWAAKSFWTEVQDGAHGSRLMEANVGNAQEAVMLDHALESSENQQQSQAFQVATAEQTKYMVDRLASFGKQPQKVLMENIPLPLAAEAMQKFNDVAALKKGVLPQDLKRLAADPYKILNVLHHQFRNGNIKLSEFTPSQLEAMFAPYVTTFGAKISKIFSAYLKKLEKGKPDFDLKDFASEIGERIPIYEIQVAPPKEKKEEKK